MEFKRRSHIMVSQVGEECLTLDASSGTCHVLNQTAGWLVSIADSFVSVESAVALARGDYEVLSGAGLAEEILEAVCMLESRGLLETR
jgi:hypothetical protein